jgi:hypothetical protein
MKNLNLLLFSLLLSFNGFAQLILDFHDECIEPERRDFTTRALCNSEDGYYFPTTGTYRMLVIFVNIIYDVNPGLNPNVVNNWGWNVTNVEGINALPPIQYFNDIFDVHNTLPRQGFFTRFISECSFDNLVILGDFTSVEIKESTIRATGIGHTAFLNSIIKYINSSGGLNTIYGYNAIEDYDNATCSYPPNSTSNNKLDYIAFFVLNPNTTLTGENIKLGGGVTSSGGLNNLQLPAGMYQTEAWTAFGVGGTHMKHESSLLVHEFAHGLLGSNSFHTSGGNHLGSCETNTFIFL